MDVREAPARAVDGIANGLKVERAHLADALILDVAPERRNERGWPTSVLAARIVGPDFTGAEIGVWAVGNDGGGPVFAIDSVAREWSSWQEDASPGSRAMEVIERVAGYPETRVVRDAVKRT